MTAAAELPQLRGWLIQLLVLIIINVPAVSFGVAVGWVSLASGAGAEDGGGAALVGAAAATFLAGAVGAPLAARALRAGRRPALLATSAAFVVCWSLKLAGGWCVVAGRAAAGAAGAAAWTLAPVLATEMLGGEWRGAGAAAPVLAHNAGVVLAYLAADLRLHIRAVEAGSLALAAAHCGACLLLPESPAFLAAGSRPEEARRALARLRGVSPSHPALAAALRALPPPSRSHSPLSLLRDMLRPRGRRRAFTVALVAVVGQEACGVLTLLQFAERVFMLAGEGREGAPLSPARLALLLGLAQLLASAAALCLLDRVGRRPLVLWGAVGTGSLLAVGAGAARAGRGGVAGAALAAAVAADSLALQPAPYAMLADMFSYEYLGCAVLLVTMAASAANAAETLVFPVVAHAAGLWAALALAAAATLAYAAFAMAFVPETRGRSPDEIYDLLCPGGCTDERARNDSYCEYGARHKERTSDCTSTSGGVDADAQIVVVNSEEAVSAATASLDGTRPPAAVGGEITDDDIPGEASGDSDRLGGDDRQDRDINAETFRKVPDSELGSGDRSNDVSGSTARGSREVSDPTSTLTSNANYTETSFINNHSETNCVGMCDDSTCLKTNSHASSVVPVNTSHVDPCSEETHSTDL